MILSQQPLLTYGRPAIPSVDWYPSMPYARSLHIKGASWPYHPVLPTPPGESTLCPTDARWSYCNRIYDSKAPLPTRVGTRHGRVWFDGPARIPVLRYNGNVWMSITPGEEFSLRGGVRAARGRVAIGGLGLGHQLRQIAQKKTVRSVVVFEREQCLCDWYGYALCAQIAEETGKSITLYCADAFSLDVSKFDSVIFDVWDTYGPAKYDAQWFSLRARAEDVGVRAWAWGG